MYNSKVSIPKFQVTDIFPVSEHRYSRVELLQGNFSDSYKQTYLRCKYYCSDGCFFYLYFRSFKVYFLYELKGKHTSKFFERYLNKHKELSFDYVLKQLFDSRIIRK